MVLQLSWRHLNLLGEYDFSEDKLQDSVGIKPPKLTDQVPSWEFRNRRKSFTPRQLARILWDFAYLCWANPTPLPIDLDAEGASKRRTGVAGCPDNGARSNKLVIKLDTVIVYFQDSSIDAHFHA